LAAQALLNAEFRSHKEAAAEFPPTISPCSNHLFRHWIPMCPTFGVTEYKAQGQTLVKAILDLKNEPTTKTPIAHKKNFVPSTSNYLDHVHSPDCIYFNFPYN
jgi:hypothetical protein